MEEELKEWSKNILRYYLNNNNHDYTNYKIVRHYDSFIIYYNNNKLFYINNKTQYEKYNISNYKIQKEYFHNSHLFYLNNKNNIIVFYKNQGIISIHNKNTKIVKMYNTKVLQINKKIYYYYNYSQNILFYYYYNIKQYIIYIYKLFDNIDDIDEEIDIIIYKLYSKHYLIMFLFIFDLFNY